MRTGYSTLTAADVPFYAELLIQKYLRLPDHGPKCRAATLWSVLFFAAARMCSLAAPCVALANAPSDTAVHDALLAGLPGFVELQRRLNRALQGDLPNALCRRRQPLAIDLTLIPFHGQHLHHAQEIYRSQAKSGTTHFHAYATAYVIRKGLRFTVVLTTVFQDEALTDVIRHYLTIIELHRQGLVAFPGQDNALPGGALAPMFRWLVKNPVYLTLADDNLILREVHARATGVRPANTSLLTRPRHRVEAETAAALGNDDLRRPVPKDPAPDQGPARHILLRALIRGGVVKGTLEW